MGKSKKNIKPQSELERLIKENEELRLEVALLKKERALVKECPTTRDWARAIEELRQEGFALGSILKMVKMDRSVFCYHLLRLKDNDGYDDTRKRIKAIYDENKSRYGYRKKRHYHSYKGQIGKVAPNVIDSNFSAERPNQKWTKDVSQV